MRTRLATWLWVFALLLSVGAAVLGISSNMALLDIGIFTLTTLGYATVGRLIASRHPENPIGWLFLVSGVAFAIAAFTDAYAIRGLRAAPGSLPAVPLAVWINHWVFVPAMSAIPLAVLLFPDGHLRSPRWRFAVWSLTGGAVLAVVGLIIKPGPAGGTVTIENPTGVAGAGDIGGALQLAGGILVLAGSILSVVSLVMRFRASRGQERQQLRWLVYVSGSAIVIFLMTWLVEAVLGQQRGEQVANFLFIAFFTILTVGIPVATGIAILRYRLYSLDLVIRRTVVFGLLAVFITVVYALVVIAIPSLVFGRDSKVGFLPFAAAALLALAFQPVRRWATRVANRLVYGDRATPYQVLAEFAERAAGSYSAEEVLPRMAELTRHGTGAIRAAVWLEVGGELRREAVDPPEDQTWPQAVRAGEALPELAHADAVVPVLHRGERLGALTVSMPAAEPLTEVHQRLLNDVASQAGLVLRNVRLIEDLRASRQRLVAAQDEERRRLERNIHDGAQQQLVALTVKMRLVQTLAAKDPTKAAQLAEQAKGELQEALDDLRDLARGIYPPLLADQGLAAALEAQARKAAVPVEVHPDGVGRYPQEVEAGAYFCVLEALQNVAKYAEASRVVVRVRTDNAHLVFEVADDGKGFDPERTPPGSGLTNMRDRLEALGGSVEIASRPGEGTTVSGRIPVQGGDQT